MPTSSWRDWVLAARPKTLAAAVVPVLCGSALARALGYSVELTLTLAALLSTICIQVATNLFNDALDFKKGADTAARLGPRRVSASGVFTPTQVLRMGCVFLALALALGIPLVMVGGWPILIIGLASLIFSYAYTGGPYPLAYNGLGEVFVVIFFGWVATHGMLYLHAQTMSPWSWLLGAQIGFLSTVLIAINNLRDFAEDTSNRKRTLAVRWGVPFAKIEITFFALAPFALGALWLRAPVPRGVAILPLFVLPHALRTVRAVWRDPPGPVYNRYLAMAAALLLSFGLLLVGGLSGVADRLSGNVANEVGAAQVSAPRPVAGQP